MTEAGNQFVFSELEGTQMNTQTRILYIGKARFGVIRKGETIDVLCLNDQAERHVSRRESKQFRRENEMMRESGLRPVHDYSPKIQAAATTEAWGDLESRVFKLLKVDGNGGKGLKIFTPFAPGYESVMDFWSAARPESQAA
jgi:hypothetical protein